MSKNSAPSSEEEIADIVRKANADSNTIEIVGGGTRLGLGNPVQADMQLSTSKVSGITIYEPGALTIVAKAGTPLSEIEKTLAKEGQHLPFEPVDYCALMGSKGNSTIGGVVACGISGPKRYQAGACRDSLIGVRFINGTGDIIKNGGRVMKNVTGYDLVKLLCGSFGTLGILSEVSFKVLPLAETTTTIVVDDLSSADAVSALAKAGTSPFDPTGLAHLPASKDQPSAQTLIRLEGFANQLEYRATQMSDLLKSFGKVHRLDEKEHLKIWQDVKECRRFAGKSGSVWRVSVKPGDAPGFLGRLDEQLDCFLDWSGGLIWIFADDDALKEKGGSSAITDNLRQALAGIGGHVTVVRASDKDDIVSAFQPQAAGVAAISAAIKQQFDPATILNPGRMNSTSK